MTSAGVRTDLAAPIFADAGDDAAAAPPVDGGAVAPKVPYDLSGYQQLTFWGRLGSAAVPSKQIVQLKLPMLVDTSVQDGGTCVDTPTNRCGASYGRFLVFTQDWTFFTVGLGPLENSIWTFPWDPTNVISIQFQASAGVAFDI